MKWKGKSISGKEKPTASPTAMPSSVEKDKGKERSEHCGSTRHNNNLAIT